jgi:hypothetical protein
MKLIRYAIIVLIIVMFVRIIISVLSVQKSFMLMKMASVGHVSLGANIVFLMNLMTMEHYVKNALIVSSGKIIIAPHVLLTA